MTDPIKSEEREIKDAEEGALKENLGKLEAYKKGLKESPEAYSERVEDKEEAYSNA